MKRGRKRVHERAPWYITESRKEYQYSAVRTLITPHRELLNDIVSLHKAASSPQQNYAQHRRYSYYHHRRHAKAQAEIVRYYRRRRKIDGA